MKVIVTWDLVKRSRNKTYDPDTEGLYTALNGLGLYRTTENGKKRLPWTTVIGTVDTEELGATLPAIAKELRTRMNAVKDVVVRRLCIVKVQSSYMAIGELDEELWRKERGLEDDDDYEVDVWKV